MNAVTRHPARILAIGAAIAVALVALLPGTWAEAQVSTAGAPATQVVTPTTVALSDTATTTVSITNGTTLDIPAGALPSGTTLSVTALDPSTLPPPPPSSTGQSFIAAAFSIDLSTGDDTELNEPATFGFTLTPEQIAALDGATPEALFFDTETNSWATGGSTCEPAVEAVWNPPTLEVTVCHFSDWIVIGEQGDEAAQVATPSPADTGMGAETESGATNTMAIILGVVALAGILGAGSRVMLGRRAS